MTIRTVGFTLAIMSGLLARAASAQDEPRVGIVMGYPASVGVMWRISDRIALRPEIDADKSSREVISSVSITLPPFPTLTPFPGIDPISRTTVTTIDSWQVSVGVSALFYLSKGDALRTYLSPRWAYSRSSSNSSSSEPALDDSGSVFRTSAQSLSGSFGAQYAISRRFSVFGELGGTFTHVTDVPQESSSSSIVVSNLTTTARGVGIRSGVGIVLYF